MGMDFFLIPSLTSPVAIMIHIKTNMEGFINKIIEEFSIKEPDQPTHATYTGFTRGDEGELGG